MVQPFPELSRKKKNISGTMASADFSWQALLRISEVHLPHVHETSPVKNMLFPSYTCLIYSGHFRIAIPCPLALYQVSVRQARCLPPASFRFQLTVDTLAFGYTLPAIGRVTDLHRLEYVRAGRTKTRGRVKFCFDPASFQVLEFRVLRVTRERNHVADVGHTGDEQQQAFETETETAVGRRAETAGVEIPPIGLFGHA